MDEYSLPDTVRIEVFSECAEETLASLQRAGFNPEIEQLSNSHSLVVVRKLAGDEALLAAAAVPPHCFAGQRGIVRRFERRE